MCKIISIVSWKGGVGKTTSAVNISAYLQMQGKRVCTVDLDPQHSLSKHFGVMPGHIKNRPTIYDLINAAVNDCDANEMNELVHQSIIHSTTVDVIPSTPMLSSLEKTLPTTICREYRLKEVLSYIKDEYDYIFLDCHPGGDLLAINALTASDSVILPVEAHILSTDGLDQVEKMIRTVQKHLNKNLKIEGIIITKFQERTNLCRQIYNLIIRDFGNHIHIFNDHIGYAIKVAEAPTFGISLHEYAPKSDAAKAYANIAMEMMCSV